VIADDGGVSDAAAPEGGPATEGGGPATEGGAPEAGAEGGTRDGGVDARDASSDTSTRPDATTPDATTTPDVNATPDATTMPDANTTPDAGGSGGTGGAGGAGGTGGSSGSGGSNPPGDDSGCSCRVGSEAPSSRSAAGLGGAMALLLGAVARRRRKAR
jgi:MYXO-CTERM domain-containing protein